jgi:hypothetical protein
MMEDDREALAIKRVIDQCRAAWVDLTPSQKLVVLDQLNRWLTLEQRSADEPIQ